MELVYQKRKHKRFLAKQNTFASFGSGFNKVGKINDISKGGLSFEYIFFDEDEDRKAKPVQRVDIFLTKDAFYLSNLPCKIVYDGDKQVCKDNWNFISTPTFTTRRCGLQFDALTEDQMEQLTYFIENHTSGPVAI